MTPRGKGLGLLPPASWRALPWSVQRQVMREAKRGIPPADPRVVSAASDLAEWTLGRALWRLGLAYCVLGAAAVALTVSSGRFNPGVLTAPLLLLSLWLQRRSGERLAAAVARSPHRPR